MKPGAVQNPPGVHPAFADVSRQAGIDYVWAIPGKRPLNILQTIGNGCAFLDYDNDGNLDILLVGPKIALYRGDGKGHFTDVSHATGLDNLRGHFLGCAVGDYDNDGYDDIYLTAYRGGALLHNERGTRFNDVTRAAGIPPQRWGTSASFVDIDNDGLLDLYVSNYVAFDPAKDRSLCEYEGILTSCAPRYYLPEKGRLYRNMGHGAFRDVTAEWNATKVNGKGLGVASVDLDGRGHVSILLANDEVPGDLLHNQGRRFDNVGGTSGTGLDEVGKAHGGMGADWGDYDNDGRFDLVVGTFEHESKNLYHNDGSLSFTDQSAALGLAEATTANVAFGVKWIDIDNDGWLDLLIANGHVEDNAAKIDPRTAYRQRTQLFRNDAGKRFVDVGRATGPAFDRPIVGRGLAVGDFDNDGRVDAVVVDSEGTPMLLHNETRNAGHWVSVRLEGSRSNRDGYGAQITFTCGGRSLLRQCAADGSYMSSSDRRVHCGLGTATGVDMTVHWPSGAVTKRQGVPCDQALIIREGTP